VTINFALNSVVDFPLHHALTGLPFAAAWDLQRQCPTPMWGDTRQTSIFGNIYGGRTIVFDRVPGSESLARRTIFDWGNQVGTQRFLYPALWNDSELMAFADITDVNPRSIGYTGNFAAVLDGAVAAHVIPYVPAMTYTAPANSSFGNICFSSPNLLKRMVINTIGEFGFILGAGVTPDPAANRYSGFTGVNQQRLWNVGLQSGDFIWSNTVTAPFQRLAHLNCLVTTPVATGLTEAITFDIPEIETALINAIAAAPNSLDQGTITKFVDGGLLVTYNGAAFTINGTPYTKVFLLLRFATQDYYVLNPISQDATTALYLAASFSNNRAVLNEEGYIFANGHTAGLFDDMFMGKALTLAVDNPGIAPLYTMGIQNVPRKRDPSPYILKG
jgi:hypothetical protein